MDENEVLVNDEVIESTEEIVSSNSGKALTIAAGAGLTIIAGVLTYKFIVKPIIAKIQAKKMDRALVDIGEDELDDEDAEEES